MKALRFYFPVMVFATMLLVSCNKDAITPSLSADALDVASASSISDQTVTDMQTMSEEATGASSLKSLSVSDSSLVPTRDKFRLNIDSTHVVIDFGTGTVCFDGKVRKGKVIIDRTLPPSKDRQGGVITFTTDGYEVNGFKVAITKTVTCLGWFTDNTYPSGYWKFTVVVENGSIIRPNGDVITVNVNHTRKLVAFQTVKGFAGWAVSGTSSNTVLRAASGKTIGSTTSIIRDLLRPLRYHHFIAGEFVSEFLSGKSVTVDYGNGNLFEPLTWGTRQVTKSDDALVTGNQE